MQYLVKALKVAADNSISIAEAGGIPMEDQEFIIDQSRLDTLLGNNVLKTKLIEIVSKIEKEETPVKKTRKKKTAE